MDILRSIFKSLFRKKSSAAAVSQTAIANLVIQATNICCGLISARALGPKGRGELAAILLWPQFFGYLLTLGIPVSCVYNVKRRPDLSGTFVAIALLVSIVMGSLGAVVGTAIIPLFLHSYSPQVINWARLIVLSSPLVLMSLTLSMQVQSAESFHLYNLFRVLPPLLIAGNLAIELFVGSLNPLTAALAYILAGTPILLWNLIWIWKHFRPSFAGGLHPVRTLLSYGLRVWGSDLLGTVSNQVDRVLVIGILSPSEAGLYVVAQSAVTLLNVIPASILAVLLPKALNRSTNEIVALVGRTARIAGASMALAGLPLAIFGHLALRLVYGAKFDGGANVLRILVAEGVIDGIAAVLTQAFLAAGCPGTVTMFQICGLATAAPLLAFMGPRWGLNGAATAMLISTSFRLAFVALCFRIRLRTAAPGLFLNKEDMAYLLRTYA